MNFKEELVKQFRQGTKTIQVSDILDRSKLHLTITSLTGDNIALDTSVKDLKIRFQPQYNKVGIWESMPYRLDSHTGKPLHTHFIYNSQRSLPQNLTIRDVFGMILGTDFNEEDFR